MFTTLLLFLAVNTTIPNPSMAPALQPRETEIRVQVQERLEQMRAVHEQKRQEIQERVLEAQQTWEQKREQFQERLQLIQDERKQETTQRLQNRLETNHKRWVNNWSIVLDRLSQILDRVELREDADAVSELIAEARAQIQSAQDLLEAQSDNVYVIEIESEETLGQSVSATISDMRSDMEEARAAVLAAKEAVREVLNALD